MLFPKCCNYAKHFPLSFLPLPPSLSAADINCCCINIQEPGREPHTAVPITASGLVDSPCPPRAEHSLKRITEYPG